MITWSRRAAASLTVLALLTASVMLGPAPASAAPPPDRGKSCIADDLGLVELSRPAPGQGARAVPVVFVHGINTDADGARWPGPLREAVEAIRARSLVLHTYAFDYHASSLNWVTNDNRIGPRLAKALMCLSRDYDLKAIVVAFSMGGLATKFAASLDADPVRDRAGKPYIADGVVGDRLAEVITIGTPFGGSWFLERAQQVLGVSAQFETGPSVSAEGQREVTATQEFLSACTADRQRLLGSDNSGAEPSLTAGEHPCDLVGRLFSPAGVPAAPVGTALQTGSGDLDDLRENYPWPGKLRVRAIGADMRIGMRVGAWPVQFQVPSPWSLGDGLVFTGSAAVGGANGPSLTVRCGVDRDSVLLAFFVSPCRHTALPVHPDVIMDVVAEVTGAAGSSLAAAPRTVTDVDWRNRAYTTNCDGAAEKSFTVVVKNGSGLESVAGGERRYQVDIIDVATGDLTGDRQPEAAVLIRCTPEPANYFTDEVQVFTEGPRPLTGTLNASDLQAAAILPPELDGDPFVIDQGQLRVGAGFYVGGDSHASGPSKRSVVIWQWEATAGKLRVMVGG